MVPQSGIIEIVKRKHRQTFKAIFTHPASGNIRWGDVEALLVELGADIEEREGSRVAVIFPGHHPVVFHRPHPSPVTDKGAVTAIRKWLARMDLKP